MRICAVVLLALFTCLSYPDAASPPPEVVADWLSQDGLTDLKSITKQTVAAVLDELGAAGADLRAQSSKGELTDLYLKACEKRRLVRLAPYLEKMKRVVFTKHFDMGGSHYAYTEGQSDAQNERHFVPGASLCLLEMDGVYGKVRTLLDDPNGVIRDPDVSYDGQRILFSWKKSLDEDDYHLYELRIAPEQVRVCGLRIESESRNPKSTRQLTFGLGFADYEGAYLPNGDIIFNSTRCVQIVDCWWTEVSNLYTCDGDGRFLRRLTFDQVHTNFPTVTPDGRVIYTRWDYNDRGQIFPQGLFQMYPDGTAQGELYGNNSWFPTTLLHARAIPGTGKYVAIFSGHHTRQKGWLGIIDPAKGREENSGAQLIAPVRDTPAVRIDAYGQSGDQFQYPYPLEPTRKDVMLNADEILRSAQNDKGEILRSALRNDRSAQNDKGLSETAFLVTLKPERAPRFGIYFVTMNGKRELLASDPKISCNQPVPLAPRPRPHVRPSTVDYRQQTATFYVQDIYGGQGLQGVPRGSIKKIRVVALEYRAAGIGHNGNSGPAGGALISTPVSIQGTWDVKKVLGTAKVYEDGSAYFTVPARTPVYFQTLDAKGHAVQTMRSWVTLQPGERRGCVGCHDNENAAPPIARNSIALQKGVQPLERESWQKEETPRGFSFIRNVQPILGRHCVRCHYLDSPPSYAQKTSGREFDPQMMRVVVPAEGARWSFTFDKPADGWTKPDFDDSAWRIGPGGFGREGTPGARVGTAWHTSDIWMRRTFELKEKPASPAFLCHHDEDVEIYVNGVLAARATGYLVSYQVLEMTPAGIAALKVGKNTMAVHCKQTAGGQFIDVALIDTADKPALPVVTEPAAPGVKPAFSLKGKQTLDLQSRREWSDSYLALANRNVADWINVQSEPSPLPPYHAGATRSQLITLLAEGHHGVKLSPDELDCLSCWIDLLVPFCGDYTEAMDESVISRYLHFLSKRKRMEEQEARNIQEFIEFSTRRASR